MSVLNFDKNSLGNLEYSLQREMLSTDRTGGYMSTTIVCCNTRKYHGLMVCPTGDDDERSYVLLSSLDETIIQHGQAFNLALHRYPGTYEPRGHKYIVDFKYTPTPTITYRVGGVLLRKEMLWIHNKAQLLIRYTLLENHSQTMLRLRPFLAFRDKHSLSHANMYADGHSYPIKGGVRCRLYDNFPWLAMQINQDGTEFVAAPEWYYNFEYAEEFRRGYDYREDLLTPGYFETEIRPNESVIFSSSLEEAASSKELNELFEKELARRSAKNDFLSCLRHSARQFVVERDGRTEVVAGFPWFGRWGRDTFISLPGIALTAGTMKKDGVKVAQAVIDTMLSQTRSGLFPNMGSAYNSVDAPLWFFWTLQQLEEHVGAEEIWGRYGKHMKRILSAYRSGIGTEVALHSNGLVWASGEHHAMTWMDAVVDGTPVTGRDGYQVEINALWYNAQCYVLRLASKFGDTRCIHEWRDEAEKTRRSFMQNFWLEDGYLADYVDQTGVNRFIRPNQVIACALEFKMLDEEQQLSVLSVLRRHLLTPKGLRTLSPRNPLYEGRYEGSQPVRDRAYHQGTVWVWPLQFYVQANFDISGAAFVPEARELVAAFDEDINSYGIGSIAEIYDGDPPHASRGAISQAWSVGAILRIVEMIDKYDTKKEETKS